MGWTDEQAKQLPEHIRRQIDEPPSYEPPAFEKKPRQARPEQELQIAIVELCDQLLFPRQVYEKCRALMPPAKVGDHLHHTPNGGGRSKAEAGIFKAMGVRRGYPDLTLDIIMHDVDPYRRVPVVYGGWRCELKADNGKLSPDQILIGERLIRMGYVFNVVTSIDEFQDRLSAYLALGTAYVVEPK